MDFNNDSENLNDLVSEIEEENSLSIEDFIKELEARENDLQISSDLAIVIDESEFDDTNPQFFTKPEFAVEPVKKPEIPQIVHNFSQNNKTFSDLEDEISQLKTQISKMESDRAESSETMRRRQTDFDNYRKRIERDRGETFVNQVSNLATQMLPVLDNLNRALDFAANHSEGLSPDFHQFFEGIVLVNQQLNEVMAEMGVVPIAAVGEYFDPHLHEAVATDESSGFPANTITGELLRGYRVGDKIIRAAMVKVAIAAAKANANNISPVIPADALDDILETE
jgi:molecular chaperone GrpE